MVDGPGAGIGLGIFLSEEDLGAGKRSLWNEDDLSRGGSLELFSRRRLPADCFDWDSGMGGSGPSGERKA